MSTRRDFLKTGAVAAAASIAGPRLLSAADGSLIHQPYLTAPSTEAYAVEFAAEAMSAAKDAGASYTDVRIGRYRRQSVNTRERQITGVSDSESYGIGIRTLVNGSWGFASTSNMTKEGVVKAAREAARIAKAARAAQKRPIELASTPVVKGTWMTPVKRDPLEVPIEEKVQLLFAANEAALKTTGTRF
ncbi:MAG: DNA gyrase modulator, partial [Gemmatimonadaceae bacterium]